MSAGPEPQRDDKAAELAAIVAEIRERVRRRYPNGPDASSVPLPDLLPILHARDAAEAKVASIGSVNQRPRGFVNDAIQSVKRLVARSLGWFVRDQVTFNQSLLACVEAQLQALRDVNYSLSLLSARTAQFGDVASLWTRSREDWERKVFQNEVQYLRATADLQAGFQHRVQLLEAQFRDVVKHQHADYGALLDRRLAEVQQRLWDDLTRLRLEHERVIHEELRIVRQRAAVQRQDTEPVTHAPAPALPFDYARFAERFRGPAEAIRERQRIYGAPFAGRKRVLDLG